jgi:hypothetical protein
VVAQRCGENSFACARVTLDLAQKMTAGEDMNKAWMDFYRL